MYKRESINILRGLKYDKSDPLFETLDSCRENAIALSEDMLRLQSRRNKGGGFFKEGEARSFEVLLNRMRYYYFNNQCDEFFLLTPEDFELYEGGIDDDVKRGPLEFYGKLIKVV